jgi:hypothetical protein
MAAPVNQRWSGIQSCTGSNDSKELERSSTETSIDAFEKTKTRVSIVGVHVGPTADYSCDGPLTLEGIVTNATSDDSSI